MTRVRVGIVSWNTADHLDRCLAALPAALEGLDADVVVVDNASSDASPQVAARHPQVQLIRNADNRGYARAMNQALAGGDADVLIALNPDTVPPPGSLAQLVERLKAQPDVALVAPRLANLDGSLQHSAYRFPSVALAAVVSFLPRQLLARGLGRRWWLEGYAPHDEPADVDWAIGAVHVLRAAAIDRDQPYDERWFMYVEDLDLCWRLAQAGWRRRLEADIVVPHAGNAAGAVAWGPGRTERWLAGTLDWYARTRGTAAMRAWALVNAAGLLWHRLIDRPRPADLGRLARAHLRAARRGAPAPDAAGPPVANAHERFGIALDHPTSADNRPRYGYGRARHGRIDAILAMHRERFAQELAALAGYADELRRIPARADGPDPCWLNPWLLGLDTVSLYGYLRRWKPARYVEVGSGQSTKVVARARADGGLATVITSIDPAPRTEIDGLCDEVIRQPLELTDLGSFAALEAGDIVFVDASHRVFMNSDMVAFYLDVLPDLPHGVLVGIHDILWPDDYLPEWRDYWFSEQYLLGAYLLGGASWLQPLLACNYAALDAELGAVLRPLWNDLALPELDTRGFCFWFTIDRRSTED